MSLSKPPVKELPRKSQKASSKSSTGSKNPTGFGYGHIGTATKIREYEDRHFYGMVKTASSMQLTLAIVADGVGGGNLGQRASQLAVDTIVEYCKSYEETDILLMMGKAIGEANRRIFDEGLSLPSKNEMSSTVAMAVIYNNKLFIANVGDSRIYLIRDRKVIQLTVDHTWANEVVREGKLSAVEANRHPNAGLLARSVGHESKVRVDLGLYLNAGNDTKEEALNHQGLLLTPNDLLLVCSDGLIKSRRDGQGNFVEVKEILEVTEGGTAEQAAKTLVDIAIGRNADDNVTAVVVEMPGRQRSFRSRLPRLQISTPAAIIISIAICMVFTGAILLLTNRGKSSTTLPTPKPGSANIISGRLFNQASGTYMEKDTVIYFDGQTLYKADQGLVTINLPGNYILYLYGTAELPTVIQLKQGADISQNQDTTKISLQKGKLVIWKAAGTDQRMNVMIETISGQAMAKFGSMGIRYQENDQQLIVDCFDPECRITSGGTTKPLPANQTFSVSAISAAQMIDSSNYSEYKDFNIPGLKIETPTATQPAATITIPPPPTITPAPTIIIENPMPSPTIPVDEEKPEPTLANDF